MIKIISITNIGRHEIRDITYHNIIANMYNDYFINIGHKSQWKHTI